MRFVFNTWYGALACWGACAVLMLIFTLVLGADDAFVWLGRILACFVGVLSLLVLAVLISFVARRKWLWALWLFMCAIPSALFFLIGDVVCSFAVVFSDSTMAKYDEGKMPWKASRPSDEIPFSIEYQPIHPFFSEYNRRVLFRSGKRIGIDVDTGGCREFAVYKMAAGDYYIVDHIDEQLKSDNHNEYRINVMRETVERRSDKYAWARIPDDTVSISFYDLGVLRVNTADGEKKSEDWVPVGNSLDGIRYVGRIYPSGKVVQGGAVPEIGRAPEPEWEPGALSEDVPFALDRQKDGDAKGHSWRLRFVSGKTLATFSSWDDDMRTHLYRMKDGRYLLERYGWCSDREYYRIDPVGESEDCSWSGCWIPIPEGALNIHHVGPSEKGTAKGRFVVDVTTKHGPAQGCGGEPMGDMYFGATYLGYYLEDGRLVSVANRYFEESVKRACEYSSSLDGKVANQKFYDLYKKIYDADPKAIRRYVESSGAWQIVDLGHHVCAYRVLACGDESCEIRINLTGKPGSHIAALKRCRNPVVMYAAAAWTLAHELNQIECPSMGNK